MYIHFTIDMCQETKFILNTLIRSSNPELDCISKDSKTKRRLIYRQFWMIKCRCCIEDIMMFVHSPSMLIVYHSRSPKIPLLFSLDFLIFLRRHRSFHQYLASLQMLPRICISPSPVIHRLSCITHKDTGTTS